MNNEFVVVVVNYFNDEEVIYFIEHEIKKQQLQPSVIAVVNNGSRNIAGLKSFCSSYADIILVEAEKNRGYLGGFLFAFEKLKAVKPQWVVLSNSDIELPSENLFKDFLQKTFPEDVALVGPSIISALTKRDQNPMYSERISLTKLKILSIVFSNYISYVLYELMGLIKSRLMTASSSALPKKMQQVYALHGSFIFIRSSFIEKHLEELKNSPFLFGEEIVLAEIALKNHQKAVYDPSLQIIHREHATTGAFKSLKSFKFFKKSIDAILKKRKNQI